jgi:hypothetical protein
MYVSVDDANIIPIKKFNVKRIWLELRPGFDSQICHLIVQRPCAIHFKGIGPDNLLKLCKCILHRFSS